MEVKQEGWETVVANELVAVQAIGSNGDGTKAKHKVTDKMKDKNKKKN